MGKITELTPEQEAELPRFRQRYLDMAQGCGLMTRYHPGETNRLRIVTDEQHERTFGSREFIGLTRNPALVAPKRFEATKKGPEDIVI